MGGQKRMSLSLYTLVKKEWAYTCRVSTSTIPAFASSFRSTSTPDRWTYTSGIEPHACEREGQQQEK